MVGGQGGSDRNRKDEHLRLPNFLDTLHIINPQHDNGNRGEDGFEHWICNDRLISEVVQIQDANHHTFVEKSLL